MASFSRSPERPGNIVQTLNVADGDPAGAETRDLFDRASSLAGIGAWQCDLRTEALT